MRFLAYMSVTFAALTMCVTVSNSKQALYCLVCYLIPLHTVNKVFSHDFSA